MFTGNILEMNFPEEIPMILIHACIVLRLMYDVALDSFDKPVFCGTLSVRSPNLARQNAVTSDRQKSLDNSRPCVSSLNLSPPNPEPLVVHGGVVVCLLRLLPSLPSVSNDPNHPHSTAMEDYLAHVLKSLVRRYKFKMRL